MFTITLYWHAFLNKTIILYLRWSTIWNTETNTQIWSSSNRFNYKYSRNYNVKIFNYIFAIRSIFILIHVSNNKTIKFESQNHINTNAILIGDAFDYNAQNHAHFTEVIWHIETRLLQPRAFWGQELRVINRPDGELWDFKNPKSRHGIHTDRRCRVRHITQA